MSDDLKKLKVDNVKLQGAFECLNREIGIFIIVGFFKPKLNINRVNTRRGGSRGRGNGNNEEGMWYFKGGWQLICIREYDYTLG